MQVHQLHRDHDGPRPLLSGEPEMLLHGVRAEGQKREGRREGDASENQRHAEVRRAGRAALARKERECAKPLEGSQNESALNGPSRQRSPHEEEGDHGQGHDDQHEVSGAEEVRAQNDEGKSRGEQAQGHAAYDIVPRVNVTALVASNPDFEAAVR